VECVLLGDHSQRVGALDPLIRVVAICEVGADTDTCSAVPDGDFVADAKIAWIAWRDVYEMQMRAAVRPLQQAAE
jgi:hypothetical protein